MAFADILRTKFANWLNAATLLESLLVSYGSASRTGSVGSTTTAFPSFVDVASMSIALSVPANSIVVVAGSIKLSHGTAGQGINWQFAEDGVIIDQYFTEIFRTASTTGYETTSSGLVLKAPSTGSHTYKMQWSVTSGTGYTSESFMKALVFRNA